GAAGDPRRERGGQVAGRRHALGDAVTVEPAELAFEEWLVRDRQQRLRRRVGERAEAGALPAHEDDRSHDDGGAEGVPPVNGVSSTGVCRAWEVGGARRDGGDVPAGANTRAIRCWSLGW